MLGMVLGEWDALQCCFFPYRYVSECEMHNNLVRHYMTPEMILEYHRFLETTVRTCEFGVFFGGCWCQSSLENVIADSIYATSEA